MSKVEIAQYNKNQFNWIAFLKGILIILMVVGHAGCPSVLRRVIYLFHMPCFFIISGYLFKEVHLNNIRGFIKKRINTLWLPFVKWTILFLFLRIIVGYAVSNQQIESISSLGRVIVSILLLNHTEQLLGGFWFISSLFVASIVTILYFRIFDHNVVSLCIGICLSLLIVMVIANYNKYFSYLMICNFMAIAYYMTGVLIAKANKIALNKVVLLVAILIIILRVIVDKWSYAEIPCMITSIVVPYYVCSTIVSWALITLCRDILQGKSIKVITILGNRTMDILVFHFLAFKIVSMIKIFHYSFPLSNIKAFPVITDHNELYWIVYTVCAIPLSLWAMDFYNKTEAYILKQCGRVKTYLSLDIAKRV